MVGGARGPSWAPCAQQPARLSRSPRQDAPSCMGSSSWSAWTPGSHRRRRPSMPFWTIAMGIVLPTSCGFPWRIPPGSSSFNPPLRPLSTSLSRGGTGCGRWRSKGAAWKRGSTCGRPWRPPRRTGRHIDLPVSGGRRRRHRSRRQAGIAVVPKAA